MNTKLNSLIVILALALLPVASFAGRNPAVQPIFFQNVEAALPSTRPAPVATVGTIDEVSLAGLAWEIANVKNSGVPLVVEFYSANVNDCVKMNAAGQDECTPQTAQSVRASAAYAGRVKFVRFNVQQHPSVINGPDVRTLPAHFFIADYTDSTHYTAIKVWGLLDEAGLKQVIQEVFKVAP